MSAARVSGPKQAAKPAVNGRPLRVALFAARGGASGHDPLAHAAGLSSALRAEGVEVVVLGEGVPAEGSPGAWWRAVAYEDSLQADAVARARAFCAAAVATLSREEQESGAFDAVHAVGWGAAPAVLVARRRGGRPAVVTMLDTVFARQGHVNGDTATAQVRRIEEQAVREADVVVAGSEAVRRELMWLYGAAADRVLIVPADPIDGVVPARAPGRDQGVVFVGDWSQAGGADLFAAAARVLRERLPDLRLLAWPEAAPRARIEADLLRRGLAGAVQVVDADAAGALPGETVALLPARTPYSARGLYRAWLAGLPVVAARTGPREAFVPGQELARPAYPFAESLAEGVLWLLGHPEAARTMAARSRTRAEQTFTWKAAASTLHARYRAWQGLYAGGAGAVGHG